MKEDAPLFYSSVLKKVIAPQTASVKRAGEGSAVVLKNGQVLLIYSRFTGGGADHDTADLFGGILDPVTGEIRDGKVYFQDSTALNQMSVSLERLQNGALGMVFLRKSAPDKDDIFFSRSSDEGESWANPVRVNRLCEDKYMVVNADRLRQFSSGRLAISAALHGNGPEAPAALGLFYSDDSGMTWAFSDRIQVLEENIIPPHALLEKDRQAWSEACQYEFRLQEPGVEELADGRILLYCRTTMGYMYQAYSADNGKTWSEMKAAADIVSPASPQSIRRIPGSQRLMCVFTDRRKVSFANAGENWNWRTPLALAISDDNAATWQILGNIEDESHNYCYTSILFIDHQILLTYYESNNTVKDGKPYRENLASLKMQILAMP
ncbi:MAG: sialidase family protein [bacterium]